MDNGRKMERKILNDEAKVENVSVTRQRQGHFTPRIDRDGKYHAVPVKITRMDRPLAPRFPPDRDVVARYPCGYFMAFAGR